MKKIHSLLYLLMFTSMALFAQPSVNVKDSANKKSPPRKDRNMFGLYLTRGVKINNDGLADGYIMFAVPNSPYVYLINRRGDVVHQWKGNYAVLNAYLQDDGSLIQNAEDPDFPVFEGGGEAGRIQKISWDSKMLWDFEYATEQYLNHHDFSVMPNGHILTIAWEAKTADEVLAAGRKPKITPKGGLWPDKIVEIEPQDKMHGRIVWEWHSWDHLIQNYDAKRANYGKLAEHPELINFNAGEDTLPKSNISKDSLDILKRQGRAGRNASLDNEGSDVFHFNAIKYNADLDQIAFSSPALSEIFIIDHSTTTEEAAGHKGGHSGKGGDILYRWGNPKNYDYGDSADRQLGFQHDIRWIEKGKPGEGHLMLFDNNHFKPFDTTYDNINYSAVYEIIPPLDNKGNYLREKGKAFGPEKPVWTYKAPDSLSFWSSFVSGAQRMYNGNTFVNEGAKGRFFEITKEGKMVWEYLNPYHGNIHMLNGDPIPAMGPVYLTFRATFIPADHPAFKNKKLEPLHPQPSVFVMAPPPDAKK